MERKVKIRLICIVTLFFAVTLTILLYHKSYVAACVMTGLFAECLHTIEKISINK